MLFISILGVVIILSCGLSVYFMLKQPRSSARPVRRESVKKEPTVAFKPEKEEKTKTAFSLPAVDEDPDVILGLRSPSRESLATAPKKPAVETPQLDLVLLHVKAEDNHYFAGYELLQELLSLGLRHGKMQLFHRHEDKAGMGSILFSVASMQEPGTFNLNTMGAFQCRGLTLFMQVKKIAQPIMGYEKMLETAYQLAEELGGVVLDEQQQLLTEASVQNTRNILKAYVLHMQHSELMGT